MIITLFIFYIRTIGYVVDNMVIVVGSPIYNEDEWSASGDVYKGGVTGLAIWAVTLAGILAGGALLVYNTSALAQ